MWVLSIGYVRAEFLAEGKSDNMGQVTNIGNWMKQFNDNPYEGELAGIYTNCNFSSKILFKLKWNLLIYKKIALEERLRPDMHICNISMYNVISFYIVYFKHYSWLLVIP